jgi:hypothetical protein
MLLSCLLQWANCLLPDLSQMTSPHPCPSSLLLLLLLLQAIPVGP